MYEINIFITNTIVFNKQFLKFLNNFLNSKKTNGINLMNVIILQIKSHLMVLHLIFIYF